jgi:hypothetical protein
VQTNAVVDPIAALYFPAAQLSHKGIPAMKEYFPDGQEVQTVEPDKEYAPAEQAEQVLFAVDPMAVP